MNELKLHRHMSQTNEYYDSPGYPVEPQTDEIAKESKAASWESEAEPWESEAAPWESEAEPWESEAAPVIPGCGVPAEERSEGVGCLTRDPVFKVSTDNSVQTQSAKVKEEKTGSRLGGRDDSGITSERLGGRDDSGIACERLGGSDDIGITSERLGCSDDSGIACERLGGNADKGEGGVTPSSPSTLPPAEPPFLSAMRGGNPGEYLNPVDFCEFLAWRGYRRWLGNGVCELVKPAGWVLERVDMLQMKQEVEEYIKGGDFIQSVKDRVFKRTKEFFKIKNLTTLPEFEGEFLRDCEDVCYKAYLNCLIRVTAQRIERLSYEHLDKYVWKEEIIQRYFEYDSAWNQGIYCRFTQNQCSDPRRLDAQGKPVFDAERHRAYLCSLGYNLHGFKSRLQPCLTIYSDSTENDRERNGGSGKSMIIQFLSAMQAPQAASNNRLVLETGENLKSDYNHNFDNVTRQTRLVVIDDLDTRRFKIGDVYSWVTVGLKVNKKGRESVFIGYEDVPKCVITSNNPVSGTRDSDLRRRMDIQLHRFYNAHHKPIQDFGRGFFGEGFTTRDWQQFDCFALWCIRLSLQHKVATQGLPAYANNVLDTSLELEIGDDLVEFLDALVLPKLEAGEEYKLDAKSLKTDYEEEYKVRRKESAKSFNKRLRRYGELRKLEVEFRPVGGVNWALFSSCLEPSV